MPVKTLGFTQDLHRKLMQQCVDHGVVAILFNEIWLKGYGKWNESKLCQIAQRQVYSAQSVMYPIVTPIFLYCSHLQMLLTHCLYGTFDCNIPIVDVFLFAIFPVFILMLFHIKPLGSRAQPAVNNSHVTCHGGWFSNFKSFCVFFQTWHRQKGGCMCPATTMHNRAINCIITTWNNLFSILIHCIMA